MCELNDFIKDINKHLHEDKPLQVKFELAELVQPNIVILLPPPVTQHHYSHN